jgi:hypothetical protein
MSGDKAEIWHPAAMAGLARQTNNIHIMTLKGENIKLSQNNSRSIP